MATDDEVTYFIPLENRVFIVPRQPEPTEDEERVYVVMPPQE